MVRATGLERKFARELPINRKEGPQSASLFWDRAVPRSNEPATNRDDDVGTLFGEGKCCHPSDSGTICNPALLSSPETSAIAPPIPARISHWLLWAAVTWMGRFALRQWTILSLLREGGRNCVIIKIVGPLSHHAASDESLQRTKRVSIFRRDKTDGIADGLRSSSPPDAVNIIFRVHREIEIHDVRNTIHVNPSGRNIGGH
jgi:hypothetical protein